MSIYLVDRAKELERIAQHLTGPAPPLLLLSGEPGIGKSRLLAEVAQRATSSGWNVLEGACRRGDTSPYEPLLTALASAVRGLEPAELRTVLQGCSWLVRLLPELAELGAVPMPAWALPADQERRLMFLAVERVLCNLAGPAGTLLLLDNLEWARGDALDLLSALVQSGARSLLRIVATCRPYDLGPEAPIGTLVADLSTSGLVTMQGVGPLPPDSAAELLDALLAEAGPMPVDVRDEALRKAEGVPFALVSYARWLGATRSLRQPAASGVAIPWDLAQVVQQRVAALSEVAQAVVRIAAVADGDDPRALLIAVAQRLGYNEFEAARGIDTACDAGLLVERGAQTYGFAHDVTQEVVEQHLGAAQRAHLHREVAEVLSSRRGQPRAEALATHLLAAGEPERAIVYLERAGTRAHALHAYTAAEQHYRTLTSRLDRGDQRWEAAQAHEQLGAVLVERGHVDEAVAQLELAAQGYRAAGDLDGVGRAVGRLGWVHLLRGDVEHGLARLEQEAADPRGLSDRGLAVLYVALARLHLAAGHYEQELAAAEQAAKFAQSARSGQLLAAAETERSTALEMAGQLDESLRVLETAVIPLTGEAGDLWTLALALDRAAHSHIARGEFAGARSCVQHGLALAQQVDDTYLTAVLRHARGVVRYHRGTWHRARADLLHAGVVLRASGMPYRAARAAVWLGRVELASGMFERALEDLQRGTALAERVGDVHTLVLANCALAEQALVGGRAEEAHARLQPLLSRSRYREADLTEVRALLGWAHVALGDVQQGAVLIAATVAQATAQGLRSVLVDALRIRALAAAREQRWEDALASVAEALELARVLAFPYAEAKVRAVYGHLLQHGGESERAGEQFAAARRLFEQLGERLYAAQLEHAANLNAALE